MVRPELTEAQALAVLELIAWAELSPAWNREHDGRELATLRRAARRFVALFQTPFAARQRKVKA